MKLSISNIAWSVEHDKDMYGFLRDNDFAGLEIAPTRLFSNEPYKNPDDAHSFSNWLIEVYNLSISSIQSIWYGITESVFGSEAERKKLVEYTKKAIDFAFALKCPNLVFGCPKNRAIPASMDYDDCIHIANDFFYEIADYAAMHGTYIALEPNPPIYHTNFINTTAQAFEFCRNLNNPGVRVNIDVGTLIYNNENINQIKENIDIVNHVHISEPYLAPITENMLHRELLTALHYLKYDKYISIEMGNPNDIELVKRIIVYVKELFCDIDI